jgi:hypothetical protein
VSYSQTNTIASEIFADTPLSRGTLAYLDERAKNAFYDYVIAKFKEAEERFGLTKAKLGRRLNKRPDQISHVLGAPGNWTISTITELLVGINREELVPSSMSFANRPRSNMRSVDTLAADADQWPKRASTSTPAPPLSESPQWDRI